MILSKLFTIDDCDLKYVSVQLMIFSLSKLFTIDEIDLKYVSLQLMIVSLSMF